MQTPKIPVSKILASNFMHSARGMASNFMHSARGMASNFMHSARGMIAKLHVASKIHDSEATCIATGGSPMKRYPITYSVMDCHSGNLTVG